MKNLKKICWTVVILFIVGFVCNNILYIVRPGYRASAADLGRVRKKSYKPGPVWGFPFVTKVYFYDAHVQKYEFKVEGKVGTLQNVTLRGALTYQLNGENVYRLCEEVGDDYQPVLINPVIEGALNQIVGGVTPEYLVFYQDLVREAVEYIVSDEFSQTGLVEAKDFRLFKPKFDKEFEKAISDKAVAAQLAEKATFDTKRVEEEAKQAMLMAQAEGKALELKSEALHNPLIVQYEIAKALGKWKGSLPSNLMLGGGIPLVSVK